MEKSNQYLRKSALACLLLFFSCSACFSEKYFSISEAELDEIQSRTSQMMISVETLTESVRTLESQRNQYLALSNELRQENERLKSKVRNYRLLAISVTAGAAIGGLAAYTLRQ